MAGRRKNLIEKARPSGVYTTKWRYTPPYQSYRKDLKTYGGHYFNLADLQRDFHRYVGMSNKDFLKNLSTALHFACIASYYKNLTPEQTLLDTGIVHRLAHLLHHESHGLLLNESFETTLNRTRGQFKRLLNLDKCK